MTEIAGIVKTMSSLEISELVESNHADVRRSIERLAEKGVISLPPLAEVSNSGAGPKTIKVYNLDKRSSLIVVAQLCPEFTARIVDRWQALEQQAAMGGFKIPASMSEALRLAADLSDKVQEQQQVIALQAPKVEALERIAQADGSMCITNAAKALQCQPKQLFGHMQAKHWIYRRAGGNGYVGYQDKIQQGLLDHKVTTIERSDGSSRMVEQVLVTPKGLTRLATILGMR